MHQVFPDNGVGLNGNDIIRRGGAAFSIFNYANGTKQKRDEQIAILQCVYNYYQFIFLLFMLILLITIPYNSKYVPKKYNIDANNPLNRIPYIDNCPFSIISCGTKLKITLFT